MVQKGTDPDHPTDPLTCGEPDCNFAPIFQKKTTNFSSDSWSDINPCHAQRRVKGEERKASLSAGCFCRP